MENLQISANSRVRASRISLQLNYQKDPVDRAEGTLGFYAGSKHGREIIWKERFTSRTLGVHAVTFFSSCLPCKVSSPFSSDLTGLLPFNFCCTVCRRQTGNSRSARNRGRPWQDVAQDSESIQIHLGTSSGWCRLVFPGGWWFLRQYEQLAYLSKKVWSQPAALFGLHGGLWEQHGCESWL